MYKFLIISKQVCTESYHMHKELRMLINDLYKSPTVCPHMASVCTVGKVIQVSAI